MSNTILPTTRGIVRQLMLLCSDPDNQEMIANEPGCIDGLVGYLESQDYEVLHTSCQAIQYLSANPVIQPILCEHPKILDLVVDLMLHDDPKISNIANSILENLNSHINGESNQQASYEESSDYNYDSIDDCIISNDNQSETLMRTITLETEGMNDEDVRKLVQRKLVCVPGVVSVTLDQSRNLAVIYAKDSSNLLQNLSDALQEVNSMKAAERDITQNQPVVPRYIENPEALYLKGHSNMSKFGHSTLEERLAEQRAEQEARRQRTKRVTRIIGKVGRGIGKGLSAFGLW